MMLTEAEIVAANQRICSILRVTSMHNDDLQGIVHDLDAITSLALRAASLDTQLHDVLMRHANKRIDDR